MNYKLIAIDTSKAVFTLHGIDAGDRVVLRGDYSRSKFQAFFRKPPPTEVVMEACSGSYHWARTLIAFLGEEIAHLDARIGEIDASFKAQHKANPLSQLLESIPGIGPITALTGDPGECRPVHLRPPFRRLDRPDATPAFLRRQDAPARHQPTRQ